MDEGKDQKHPDDQKKHHQHQMGTRGVSRPMATMHNQKKQKEGKQPDMMSPEGRVQIRQMHHMQTLWIYWTIIILGVWMILAPLTFDFGKTISMPSGGREVWISLSARTAAIMWSDIISGLLLVYFGWLSLKPEKSNALWGACAVGIWLTMAPVIFWAPSAVAYLNDTLVGALIISLSILIPGMPNMIIYMKMGTKTPPGWSYNPSNWPQRWIMILTGFLGWMVSRYLAAFQLGYIDTIWDPFFGEGSRLVLNSRMSHSLPVSDGALGSLAYTFEFLMGWMGSPARWRTMPWMVAFFGILVIPLGLVHIFLVISQPLVVGHWCTFCLLAAGIMLPMIPLEVDEVFAMFQYLKKAKREGKNLWKKFWKGGSMKNDDEEEGPALMELPYRPKSVFKESIRGVSAPINLIITSLLGLLLMFSPAVYGVSGSGANLGHLTGALIIVSSILAWGELLRTVRFLNFLLGAGLAIATWMMGDSGLAFNINNLILGILVVALSIKKGKITESYGPMERFIK